MVATNPWDKPGMAQSIDKYWETSELEQEWYTILRGALKQYIVPGTLLEVGCGSGKVHEALDPFIPYVGCDISTEMLKLHQQRFPQAFLKHMTELYKLPVNAGEDYDNVLCVSVLQHVEQPEPLIAEMAKAARKRLIVVTWAHDKKTSLIRDAQGFCQNVYNNYAFMEMLMKPKLGTLAFNGRLYLNNYVYCVSYGRQQ